MMNVIGPVQFHPTIMKAVQTPVGNRRLRWAGLVEKVGFEPGVKE